MEKINYSLARKNCGETYKNLNGLLQRVVERKAMITTEAYRNSKVDVSGKELQFYTKYCDFYAKKAQLNPSRYQEEDDMVNKMYSKQQYDAYIQNEIRLKTIAINKDYTSSANLLPMHQLER